MPKPAGVTPPHGIGSTRTRWRWVRRAVALVVAAIAGVVITLHTDWGREVARTRIEAELREMFVGGATIGKLEGSVFGTLVLRDVVLDGPDHRPAIRIAELQFELGLLPLLSHRALLDHVVANGVDLNLERAPNGDLEVAHLLAPATRSLWSIELPDIELHGAHVACDTGDGGINVDAIASVGSVRLSAADGVHIAVALNGRWRERAVPIDLAIVMNADDRATAITSLTAHVGEISLAASNVRVATSVPGGPRLIAGVVAVNAPALAIARLVPQVNLPADLSLVISATAGAPWTELAVSGQIGHTPAYAMLAVNLDPGRASGTLMTGEFELATLSRGAIHGTAATMTTFDLTPGRAGQLPVGHATIQLWGTFAGIAATRATIALDTTGEHMRTVIDASGAGSRTTITAQLHRVSQAIVLDTAHVVASTRDPERVSRGVVPLHGAVQADLNVRGTLYPHLDLGVTGTARGEQLRSHELSVASLRLAIDATHVPFAPVGHASVQLVDLVQGTRHFGELTIDVANRAADRKLVVAVRSRPKHRGWLVDLDALVTPPGKDDVIAIDLSAHHVRTDRGIDWTGTTGHVAIRPDRIELRDLRTTSADGAISIAGSVSRTGGDLIATVDARLGLDELGIPYHGTGHVLLDVARRAGSWSGHADLDATVITTTPARTYEVAAKLAARAGNLTIDADATSAGLGHVKLALDLDAPRDVTNVASWRSLGRSAIRSADVSLQGGDLAKTAELAGLGTGYHGRVDGDFKISATTTIGVVKVRELAAPVLSGSGVTSIDLAVSQGAFDEVATALTITVDKIGKIDATARLATPDHVFDPAAWRSLGWKALRGGSVRGQDIVIDPALLARLHITSPEFTTLRGKLGFALDIDEGGGGAQLAVEIAKLRGDPIDRPIDIHVAATIDATSTKATIGVRCGSLAVLDLVGAMPITMAQLTADPRGIWAARFDVTGTLPKIRAQSLLSIFGRTDITGGVVAGKFSFAGTVGRPIFQARFVATNLDSPGRLGSSAIRTVKELALEATWNDRAGTLTLDGIEDAGHTIHVQVQGSSRIDATARLVATKFDLAPLLAFLPGPGGSASGQLDANLALTGLDPRTAKLVGELHLTGARIPIAPSVGTLRRAKIDVTMREHDIVIALDGRLGAGTIKGAGSIALDGQSPTSGTAKLTLRKVSPIGVLEPVIDADITAKLVHQRLTWTGDFVVDHGHIVIPSDRGEAFKQPGAPPDMVFENGERITQRPMKKMTPSRPVFIANIVLNPTQVTSDEMRTVISGKLVVSADREAIGVNGTIEGARGDLDLFAHRYQVDHALVHFDGSTDPLLDLRITHDFTDVTTITEIHGRLSKPELALSSDPGTYSQGQLLGFLLGGEPTGDPLSASERVTDAGTSLVASTLGGYVRKSLPIDLDVLRYEAGTATTSSAVTVGTWLWPSLFLAYRQHIGSRPDENTGEAEVEYWLSHHFVVEGTVGDHSYDGVDLLWRKRY